MALEQPTAVRPQDTTNESEDKSKEKDRKPVNNETDLADPKNNNLIERGRPIMNQNGLPGLTLEGNNKDLPERMQTNFNARSEKFVPMSLVEGDGDGGDEKGTVTKDDQGRVIGVEYPNGKKREFGYDDKGQLNKIVQPTGETLVLKDGKWQYEQKEKPAGGDKAGGAIGGVLGGVPDISNPQVSSDGTFTFERKDGSKTSITSDGKSERDTKDGAKVYADIDGHVTSVKYANGDSREFTYDRDGQLKTATENGKKFTIKDGKLVDEDGKESGRKNAFISPDGKFSYSDSDGTFTTINTDRTSRNAKKDGSFVSKDASGHVTEVDYPDGKTEKFGYDEKGNLTTITDKDGKEFKFKGNYVLGIRIGGFEADDGSQMNGVQLKSDGTLTYRDKDGHIHNDFTTGNSTETTKTADELRETAKKIHDGNNFFSNGEDVKKQLEGLSPADRAALDQQYKNEYGETLTDTLKEQRGNPFKSGNINEALVMMTDAQLRVQAEATFSDPKEHADAIKQIDDFQQRAKDQNIPADKIADAQLKAIDGLKNHGDKDPSELLQGMEKALTDTAPTIESLNTKYGVKYDEEKQADGSTVRHYYVEGEGGKKLPVLDSNSDDPVEVEKQLREWRDNKAHELEQKYNVEFSKDGSHDDGKNVDTRAPRIDELLALEDGFKHSEPSTTTQNGRPILVQFAVTPTSPFDAYVQSTEDGQQRILFEPLNRDYRGLRDTIIHEWAHNGQNNLNERDPDGLNQVYEQMGYRKVKTEGGDDQWQFRDKDGNYWTQGPDQFPFGNWTRVDEQGHPLKADGTRASGWDDQDAAVRSTDEMRDAAAVRPTTSYFPYPWENGAEAQIFYRTSDKTRAELYMNDPTGYEAAKKFDQLDLDNDPRYGRNSDGSSKYIRLPNGDIAENNAENRKAVADYEAELKRQYEEKKNKPDTVPGRSHDGNKQDKSHP